MEIKRDGYLKKIISYMWDGCVSVLVVILYSTINICFFQSSAEKQTVRAPTP